MLHAALHGGDAHNHALELATAENAIRLAERFAVQQLDILAKGRRQAAAKVEDEVLELLDDRIHGKRLEPEERQLGRSIDYLSARTLQRARIATADAARALLELRIG